MAFNSTGNNSSFDLDEKTLAMSKTSIFFLLGYLAYCLLVFGILKLLKFDLVYGLVGMLRRKKCGVGCIKIGIVVYLSLLGIIPLTIAVAWALTLSAEQDRDPLRSAGICLTILFSTAVLLSFSAWYGSKWYMSRVVGALMGIAVLSGWLFALVTIFLGSNFSFTGTSATLLSANFLPACYIVYEKSTHNDIPIKRLFSTVAEKMAKTKSNETNE